MFFLLFSLRHCLTPGLLHCRCLLVISCLMETRVQLPSNSYLGSDNSSKALVPIVLGGAGSTGNSCVFSNPAKSFLWAETRPRSLWSLSAVPLSWVGVTPRSPVVWKQMVLLSIVGRSTAAERLCHHAYVTRPTPSHRVGILSSHIITRARVSSVQ